MRKLLRRLVTLLVVVAIPATLLVGVTPAQAAPSPAAPLPNVPAMPQGGASTVTVLSAIQWRAAKMVTKARNHAVNTSGTKMNYRKMKKVFGTKNATQVSWRRQAAAGFRQAGGRIVYISKAENKAVEKMRKKIYGKKKPAGPTTAGRLAKAAPVPCRGANKVVNGRNFQDHYLDSCRSQKVKWALAGCVGAMAGIMAGILTFTNSKRAAIAPFVIGALCGIGSWFWEDAIDNSTIKAVIFRAQQVQVVAGPVRHYRIFWSVRPQ